MAIIMSMYTAGAKSGKLTTVWAHPPGAQVSLSLQSQLPRASCKSTAKLTRSVTGSVTSASTAEGPHAYSSSNQATGIVIASPDSKSRITAFCAASSSICSCVEPTVK